MLNAVNSLGQVEVRYGPLAYDAAICSAMTEIAIEIIPAAVRSSEGS